MKIGYIRISSKTQNLIRQLEVMRELGIEDRFIFQDIASGNDFERPRLYFYERGIERRGCIIY